MLKWKTEEKKQEKMTNREWFRKRALGGGGGKRAKHLSNCRKPFVCISYNSTPFENPRIAGKTAFVVIISKQNNRHKQKKGRSTKKTEIKNTTTIKTPTTEKPGGPKCKKLGSGKGMRWNWP